MLRSFEEWREEINDDIGAIVNSLQQLDDQQMRTDERTRYFAHIQREASRLQRDVYRLALDVYNITSDMIDEAQP